MTLQGKRIVITRPPNKAKSFARQLEAFGAIPVLMPLIEIQALLDTHQLDEKLSQLESYDWLILTSANTIHHVWERLDILNPQTPLPRIAVVGTATATALTQHHITANFVPRIHTAESLFKELSVVEDLSEKRILLPQGNWAPPLLKDLLTSTGAMVDSVIAYQTVHAKIDPNQFTAMPFDAITFTSPSTVDNFCETFDDPLAVIGSAAVACIGTVTAQTAENAGLSVNVVANPHTIEGLIDCLSQLFERMTTP